MVKLHSSMTTIIDPVDVWGDEKSIGLDEHAARRLAPPITSFSGSGNILFWDDYESAVKKYEMYQALGGTVTRSIDYAHGGDFSLKCEPTGGAGAQAGATYYLTDFHESKISMKVSITSTHHTGWYFYVSMMYYDGANLNSATIRYSADGSIDYYNSSGSWTSLISIPRYGNVHNWGSISLDVDLVSKKYISSRVYREQIDLSNHGMKISASTEKPHLLLRTHFEDIAGTSIVGYLDDLIVMENV